MSGVQRNITVLSHGNSVSSLAQMSGTPQTKKVATAFNDNDDDPPSQALTCSVPLDASENALLSASLATGLPVPTQISSPESSLMQSFTFEPHENIHWISATGATVSLLDDSLSLISTFDPIASVINMVPSLKRSWEAYVASKKPRVESPSSSFSYSFSTSYSNTDVKKKAVYLPPVAFDSSSLHAMSTLALRASTGHELHISSLSVHGPSSLVTLAVDDIILVFKLAFTKIPSAPVFSTSASLPSTSTCMHGPTSPHIAPPAIFSSSAIANFLKGEHISQNDYSESSSVDSAVGIWSLQCVSATVVPHAVLDALPAPVVAMCTHTAYAREPLVNTVHVSGKNTSIQNSPNSSGSGGCSGVVTEMSQCSTAHDEQHLHGPSEGLAPLREAGWASGCVNGRALPLIIAATPLHIISYILHEATLIPQWFCPSLLAPPQEYVRPDPENSDVPDVIDNSIIEEYYNPENIPKEFPAPVMTRLSPSGLWLSLVVTGSASVIVHRLPHKYPYTYYTSIPSLCSSTPSTSTSTSTSTPAAYTSFPSLAAHIASSASLPCLPIASLPAHASVLRHNCNIICVEFNPTPRLFDDFLLVLLESGLLRVYRHHLHPSLTAASTALPPVLPLPPIPMYFLPHKSTLLPPAPSLSLADVLENIRSLSSSSSHFVSPSISALPPSSPWTQAVDHRSSKNTSDTDLRRVELANAAAATSIVAEQESPMESAFGLTSQSTTGPFGSLSYPYATPALDVAATSPTSIAPPGSLTHALLQGILVEHERGAAKAAGRDVYGNGVSNSHDEYSATGTGYSEGAYGTMDISHNSAAYSYGQSSVDKDAYAGYGNNFNSTTPNALNGALPLHASRSFPCPSPTASLSLTEAEIAAVFARNQSHGSQVFDPLTLTVAYTASSLLDSARTSTIALPPQRFLSAAWVQPSVDTDNARTLLSLSEALIVAQNAADLDNSDVTEPQGVSAVVNKFIQRAKAATKQRTNLLSTAIRVSEAKVYGDSAGGSIDGVSAEAAEQDGITADGIVEGALDLGVHFHAGTPTAALAATRTAAIAYALSQIPLIQIYQRGTLHGSSSYWPHMHSLVNTPTRLTTCFGLESWCPSLAQLCWDESEVPLSLLTAAARDHTSVLTIPTYYSTLTPLAKALSADARFPSTHIVTTDSIGSLSCHLMSSLSALPRAQVDVITLFHIGRTPALATEAHLTVWRQDTQANDAVATAFVGMDATSGNGPSSSSSIGENEMILTVFVHTKCGAVHKFISTRKGANGTKIEGWIQTTAGGMLPPIRKLQVPEKYAFSLFSQSSKLCYHRKTLHLLAALSRVMQHDGYSTFSKKNMVNLRSDTHLYLPYYLKVTPSQISIYQHHASLSLSMAPATASLQLHSHVLSTKQQREAERRSVVVNVIDMILQDPRDFTTLTVREILQSLPQPSESQTSGIPVDSRNVDPVKQRVLSALALALTSTRAAPTYTTANLLPLGDSRSIEIVAYGYIITRENPFSLSHSSHAHDTFPHMHLSPGHSPSASASISRAASASAATGAGVGLGVAPASSYTDTLLAHMPLLCPHATDPEPLPVRASHTHAYTHSSASPSSSGSAAGAGAMDMGASMGDAAMHASTHSDSFSPFTASLSGLYIVPVADVYVLNAAAATTPGQALWTLVSRVILPLPQVYLPLPLAPTPVATVTTNVNTPTASPTSSVSAYSPFALHPVSSLSALILAAAPTTSTTLRGIYTPADTLVVPDSATYHEAQKLTFGSLSSPTSPPIPSSTWDMSCVAYASIIASLSFPHDVFNVDAPVAVQAWPVWISTHNTLIDVTKLLNTIANKRASAATSPASTSASANTPTYTYLAAEEGKVDYNYTSGAGHGAGASAAGADAWMREVIGTTTSSSTCAAVLTNKALVGLVRVDVVAAGVSGAEDGDGEAGPDLEAVGQKKSQRDGETQKREKQCKLTNGTPSSLTFSPPLNMQADGILQSSGIIAVSATKSGKVILSEIPVSGIPYAELSEKELSRVKSSMTLPPPTHIPLFTQSGAPIAHIIVVSMYVIVTVSSDGMARVWMGPSGSFTCETVLSLASLLRAQLRLPAASPVPPHLYGKWPQVLDVGDGIVRLLFPSTVPGCIDVYAPHAEAYSISPSSAGTFQPLTAAATSTTISPHNSHWLLLTRALLAPRGLSVLYIDHVWPCFLACALTNTITCVRAATSTSTSTSASTTLDICPSLAPLAVRLAPFSALLAPIPSSLKATSQLMELMKTQAHTLPSLSPFHPASLLADVRNGNIAKVVNVLAHLHHVYISATHNTHHSRVFAAVNGVVAVTTSTSTSTTTSSSFSISSSSLSTLSTTTSTSTTTTTTTTTTNRFNFPSSICLPCPTLIASPIPALLAPNIDDVKQAMRLQKAAEREKKEAAAMAKAGMGMGGQAHAYMHTSAPASAPAATTTSTATSASVSRVVAPTKVRSMLDSDSDSDADNGFGLPDPRAAANTANASAAAARPAAQPKVRSMLDSDSDSDDNGFGIPDPRAATSTAAAFTPAPAAAVAGGRPSQPKVRNMLDSESSDDDNSFGIPDPRSTNTNTSTNPTPSGAAAGKSTFTQPKVRNMLDSDSSDDDNSFGIPNPRAAATNTAPASIPAPTSTAASANAARPAAPKVRSMLDSDSDSDDNGFGIPNPRTAPASSAATRTTTATVPAPAASVAGASAGTKQPKVRNMLDSDSSDDDNGFGIPNPRVVPASTTSTSAAAVRLATQPKVRSMLDSDSDDDGFGFPDPRAATATATTAKVKTKPTNTNTNADATSSLPSPVPTLPPRDPDTVDSVHLEVERRMRTFCKAYPAFTSLPSLPFTMVHAAELVLTLTGRPLPPLPADYLSLCGKRAATGAGAAAGEEEEEEYVPIVDTALADALRLVVADEAGLPASLMSTLTSLPFLSPTATRELVAMILAVAALPPLSLAHVDTSKLPPAPTTTSYLLPTNPKPCTLLTTTAGAITGVGLALPLPRAPPPARNDYYTPTPAVDMQSPAEKILNNTPISRPTLDEGSLDSFAVRYTVTASAALITIAESIRERRRRQLLEQAVAERGIGAGTGYGMEIKLGVGPGGVSTASMANNNSSSLGSRDSGGVGVGSTPLSMGVSVPTVQQTVARAQSVEIDWLVDISDVFTDDGNGSFTPSSSSASTAASTGGSGTGSSSGSGAPSISTLISVATTPTGLISLTPMPTHPSSLSSVPMWAVACLLHSRTPHAALHTLLSQASAVNKAFLACVCGKGDGASGGYTGGSSGGFGMGASSGVGAGKNIIDTAMALVNLQTTPPPLSLSLPATSTPPPSFTPTASPLDAETLKWALYRALGLGYLLASPNTDIEYVRMHMTRLAKAQYARSKAANDCLLWYMILGHKADFMALLKGEPAMQKAYQFFVNDFSQPQWREKACANAYNSIAKAKYQVAASFFLLAGMPEDAARVLIRNEGDAQLALVLARLAGAAGMGNAIRDRTDARYDDDVVLGVDTKGILPRRVTVLPRLMSSPTSPSSSSPALPEAASSPAASGRTSGPPSIPPHNAITVSLFERVIREEMMPAAVKSGDRWQLHTCYTLLGDVERAALALVVPCIGGVNRSTTAILPPATPTLNSPSASAATGRNPNPSIGADGVSSDLGSGRFVFDLVNSMTLSYRQAVNVALVHDRILKMMAATSSTAVTSVTPSIPTTLSHTTSLHATSTPAPALKRAQRVRPCAASRDLLTSFLRSLSLSSAFAAKRAGCASLALDMLLLYHAVPHIASVYVAADKDLRLMTGDSDDDEDEDEQYTPPTASGLGILGTFLPESMDSEPPAPSTPSQRHRTLLCADLTARCAASVLCTVIIFRQPHTTPRAVALSLLRKAFSTSTSTSASTPHEGDAVEMPALTRSKTVSTPLALSSVPPIVSRLLLAPHTLSPSFAVYNNIMDGHWPAWFSALTSHHAAAPHHLFPVLTRFLLGHMALSSFVSFNAALQQHITLLATPVRNTYLRIASLAPSRPLLSPTSAATTSATASTAASTSTSSSPQLALPSLVDAYLPLPLAGPHALMSLLSHEVEVITTALRIQSLSSLLGSPSLWTSTTTLWHRIDRLHGVLTRMHAQTQVTAHANLTCMDLMPVLTPLLKHNTLVHTHMPHSDGSRHETRTCDVCAGAGVLYGSQALAIVRAQNQQAAAAASSGSGGAGASSPLPILPPPSLSLRTLTPQVPAHILTDGLTPPAFAHGYLSMAARLATSSKQSPHPLASFLLQHCPASARPAMVLAYALGDITAFLSSLATLSLPALYSTLTASLPLPAPEYTSVLAPLLSAPTAVKKLTVAQVQAALASAGMQPASFPVPALLLPLVIDPAATSTLTSTTSSASASVYSLLRDESLLPQPKSALLRQILAQPTAAKLSQRWRTVALAIFTLSCVRAFTAKFTALYGPEGHLSPRKWYSSSLIAAEALPPVEAYQVLCPHCSSNNTSGGSGGGGVSHSTATLSSAVYVPLAPTAALRPLRDRSVRLLASLHRSLQHAMASLQHHLRAAIMRALHETAREKAMFELPTQSKLRARYYSSGGDAFLGIDTANTGATVTVPGSADKDKNEEKEESSVSSLAARRRLRRAGMGMGAGGNDSDEEHNEDDDKLALVMSTLNTHATQPSTSNSTSTSTSTFAANITASAAANTRTSETYTFPSPPTSPPSIPSPSSPLLPRLLTHEQAPWPQLDEGVLTLPITPDVPAVHALLRPTDALLALDSRLQYPSLALSFAAHTDTTQSATIAAPFPSSAPMSKATGAGTGMGTGASHAPSSPLTLHPGIAHVHTLTSPAPLYGTSLLSSPSAFSSLAEEEDTDTTFRPFPVFSLLESLLLCPLPSPHARALWSLCRLYPSLLSPVHALMGRIGCSQQEYPALLYTPSLPVPTDFTPLFPVDYTLETPVSIVRPSPQCHALMQYTHGIPTITEARSNFLPNIMPRRNFYTSASSSTLPSIPPSKVALGSAYALLSSLHACLTRALTAARRMDATVSLTLPPAALAIAARAALHLLPPALHTHLHGPLPVYQGNPRAPIPSVNATSALTPTDLSALSAPHTPYAATISGSHLIVATAHGIREISLSALTAARYALTQHQSAPLVPTPLPHTHSTSQSTGGKSSQVSVSGSSHSNTSTASSAMASIAIPSEPAPLTVTLAQNNAVTVYPSALLSGVTDTAFPLPTPPLPVYSLTSSARAALSQSPAATLTALFTPATAPFFSTTLTQAPLPTLVLAPAHTALVTPFPAADAAWTEVLGDIFSREAILGYTPALPPTRSGVIAPPLLPVLAHTISSSPHDLTSVALLHLYSLTLPAPPTTPVVAPLLPLPTARALYYNGTTVTDMAQFLSGQIANAVYNDLVLPAFSRMQLEASLAADGQNVSLAWLQCAPLAHSLRSGPAHKIVTHPTLPLYFTATNGNILLWHKHCPVPLAHFATNTRNTCLDVAYGFSASLALTSAAPTAPSGASHTYAYTPQSGLHALRFTGAAAQWDMSARTVVCLAIDRDGTRLAAMYDDGVVGVWMLSAQLSQYHYISQQSGVTQGHWTMPAIPALHMFRAHDAAGSAVCFLDNAFTLATAGSSTNKANVAIWDLLRPPTSLCVAAFNICNSEAVADVTRAYNPYSQEYSVLVRGQPSVVTDTSRLAQAYQWDSSHKFAEPLFASPRDTAAHTGPSGAESLAYVYDKGLLAVGGRGPVYLLDMTRLCVWQCVDNGKCDRSRVVDAVCATVADAIVATCADIYAATPTQQAHTLMLVGDEPTVITAGRPTSGYSSAGYSDHASMSAGGVSHSSGLQGIPEGSEGGTPTSTPRTPHASTSTTKDTAALPTEAVIRSRYVHTTSTANAPTSAPAPAPPAKGATATAPMVIRVCYSASMQAVLCADSLGDVTILQLQRVPLPLLPPAIAQVSEVYSALRESVVKPTTTTTATSSSGSASNAYRGSARSNLSSASASVPHTHIYSYTHLMTNVTTAYGPGLVCTYVCERDRKKKKEMRLPWRKEEVKTEVLDMDVGRNEEGDVICVTYADGSVIMWRHVRG